LQTSSSERAAVTTDTVVTLESLIDQHTATGIDSSNSINNSTASAGTETFEVFRVTPAYATSTLQHPELHYQTSGDSVTEHNSSATAAATDHQQQPALVKTGSFRLIRSRSNTLDGSNIGTSSNTVGIAADVSGSGSSSRY
jgi:ABC-type Na+ efflux pump permease subunit